MTWVTHKRTQCCYMCMSVEHSTGSVQLQKGRGGVYYCIPTFIVSERTYTSPQYMTVTYIATLPLYASNSHTSYIKFTLPLSLLPRCPHSFDISMAHTTPISYVHYPCHGQHIREYTSHSHDRKWANTVFIARCPACRHHKNSCPTIFMSYPEFSPCRLWLISYA